MYTVWGILALVLAVITLLCAGLPSIAGAQGNAGWMATIVVQPNPSPFVADWERNPTIAILNIAYTDRPARDFKVQVFARTARGELARVESPVLSFAGGPSTQVFTAIDVADWKTLSSDKEAIRTIRRTGVIPEGRYELCARILDPAGQQLAENCARFEIALPEAPRLLFPSNNTSVNSRMAVFQWTGISALPQSSVRYRLRVYEQLDGQTPVTATQANPVYFETVVETPMLVYPNDGLPLRAGRQYAWQIEAVDEDGNPVTRGGERSEIWSFTASDAVISNPTQSLELPDELELIPNAARLGGFHTAQVKGDDFTLTVNGPLRLKLLAPFPATIDVQATGLILDRGALPAIRVLGGRLRGTVSSDLVPASFRGDFITFTDIEYTPTNGLSFGAAFQFPGTSPTAFAQRVRLMPEGLYGTLSLDKQVLLAGSSPVRLGVHRVDVRYPFASVDLKGGLELFGKDAGCALTFTTPGDGIIAVAPRCLSVTQLPVAGDGAGLNLVVRNLAGSLTLKPSTNALEYSLTGAASLSIGAATHCGASMSLTLEQGNVSLGTPAVRCDAGEGAVSMGWLKGKLSTLSIESFAWSTAKNVFDFMITADMQPIVADHEEFILPPLTGVRFAPDGVHFPATDASVTSKAASYGFYDVTPTHVTAAAVVVPWSVWKTGKQGNFEDGGAAVGERLTYQFRGNLALDPFIPGIKIPACITDQRVPIESGIASAAELRLTLKEQTYAAGCELRVSPANSFSFEITRVTGNIVHRADLSQLSQNRDADIFGAFLLPEAFTCSAVGQPHRLEITQPLHLVRGGVTGVITGFAPKCPVDLPLFRITTSDGTLTLGVQDGQQTARLASTASVMFSGTTTPVTGKGKLHMDLITGKILDSDIDFQGPFRFDIPRERPVLSFEIQRARLDSTGLLIDGRNKLLLGAQSISTTFDRVIIDPSSGKLSNGRVLFDVPFALEAELSDSISLAWRAVAAGSEVTMANGLRVDLPREIALSRDGFTAQGRASGQLRFSGRDLDSLMLDFSNDLAMQITPFAVRLGKIDFHLDSSLVAMVDSLGFHPNFGYFARKLIPDRLPLPSEEVAYVQLRDSSGTLLVVADTTPQGVRIRTRPGQTVSLVFPALRLNRPTTPSIDVALDLTIGTVSGEIVAGAIHARIPDASRLQFDLLAHGLPVALDTISYERKAGEDFQMFLGGQLRLFGALQAKPGSVRLTLDGTGRLHGDVAVVADKNDSALPLVASSDKLLYRIDSIRGRFDANLREQSLKYNLDVGGALSLRLDATRRYDVAARIRATDRLIEVTDIATTTSDTSSYLAFDAFRMQLQNVRVPKLVYSHERNKFDFEILFDAGFAFPQFDGLVLPPLRDIALRDDGFTIPEYQIPDMSAMEATWYGFQVKPVAFRMPKTQVAWFSDTPIRDWGFRFDLELRFKNWPVDAPDWIRNAKLSVLDAGISNGYIVGRIEQREVQQAIKAGKEVVVDVKRIYGQLTDPTSEDTAARNSQQDSTLAADSAAKKPFVDLYVEGEFSLGRHGSCNATPEKFQVATGSLRFRGNGGFEGLLRDFIPKCPITMGPVTLTPGSSVLGLGVPYDTTGIHGDSTQVWLKTAASVTVPGVNPGTTVTGNGTVTLELTEPKLLDGYVTLDEPFRIDLPTASPVFSFILERGRIDARGLRVSGGGRLALDAGRFVNVDFRDVVFNPSTLRITSGEASFLGKFALASSISESGTLAWRTTEAGAVFPSGSGFVITLPDTLTLSKAGLGIRGSAGASLMYGDSTFASLTTHFQNDFTLDLSGEGKLPVRVARGRLEFVRGGILAGGGSQSPKPDTTVRDTTQTLRSLVAHIDSLGFWPGDIFGMLPIPARLGLPDTTIAYVELRDANGDLLVESSSSAEGVRLRTKGQGVRLVIPALTQNAQVPTVPVTFDVVINPNSRRIISGSIVADVNTALGTAARELFSLSNLGIPVSVTKLAYMAKELEGYQFRLDGRVALPGVLDSLDLQVRDVVVTKDGLRGAAELGTYADRWSPTAPVVNRAILRAEGGDTLAFELTGAKAMFAGRESTLDFSGQLRSTLFSTDSTLAPIFITGHASANGVKILATPENGAGRILPLSLATFELQPVSGSPAMEVIATAEEFALRLSGTLRVPSLGDRFAISIAGLKIGTRGIELPSVSLREADRQTLELFGATFTLRDSVNAGGQLVYPALALTREQRILALTLSGDVKLLGNTAQFHGLRVSTNGNLSLAQANLLSNPLRLIAGHLTLDTLVIRDNALVVSTLVSLPAPFDGGQSGGQRANFSIAANGSMSGGGRISLINETAGLTNAKFATRLPAVTTHLRYLGLTLDVGSAEQSALEMVADLYLQHQESNRIRIGNTAGGSIQPGLRYSFDGVATLANIDLADTLSFGYDAARLTVYNISAPGTPEDFQILLAGKLALDIAAVKGGVQFSNVALTSQGDVKLDNATVGGGELVIGDVVRLEINGFQYSRTPTTIVVAGGSMPFGGTAPTSDSTRINVNSVIRFGGLVDVQGVLAGGVKEFLFYKTPEGETRLVVKEAGLNVYGVVTMTGDFLYRAQGNDFEMALGARGTILKGPGMAFVGIVSKDATKMRMGIFAAVTGMHLPVAPGVNLTDLGAGFFYNPKPEYVSYVRNFTGLSGKAQLKVKTGDNDKFAVMVYGGAEITPARLVTGRVLVTVTPTIFMLDGEVVVLDQGDRFKGEAHLAVGLNRPFAEGNIELNVDYGAVISGSSRLQFYVYENAWGIQGNLDVNLVKLVQGRGQLFIGSPGFLVAASVKVPSLWLISVKRAEAMAFYRSASNEWGATAAIGVEVAVIPEVLSVEGTLEGALIRPQGQSPFLYVVAELEAHVIVASFKGSVWAKVGGDGLDAGFGRDHALEQVIARAVGMVDEMNEARDEGQAAIVEARQNVAPEVPIALTEAELVSAYNRIQGWSPEKFEIARALSVDLAESEYFPQPGQAEYFAWYLNVLRQQGAPDASNAIRQYQDSVATYVSVLSARQSAVEARIRDIRANISALSVATGTSGIPGLAIDTNFTLVTREEIRGNDTVKVATSVPTFSLDDAAASAQRTALEQNYQNMQSFDLEVRQRLQNMEEGLATVRKVTTATDDGSLLSYARLHGAVTAAAQRQFALQADQIMSKQDWLNTKIGELNARQSLIDGIITKKTQMLRAAYSNCAVLLAPVTPGSGAGGNKYDDIQDNRERAEEKKQCQAAYQLRKFARRRVEALQAWTGGTLLSSFDATAATMKDYNVWFAQRADLDGRDLWFNLAAAGMRSAAAGADTALVNLRQRTEPTLTNLRGAHEKLSESLARLYEDQAELTAILFDAYDRYLYIKRGNDALPPELASFSARRDQLRGELAVPKVGAVSVVQSQNGYMTTTAISWTGSHPAGAYEYTFRNFDGSNVGLGGSLLSNGSSGTYTFFDVAPDRNAAPVARTAHMGVRGGAGYLGYGKTSYNVTYARSGNIQTVPSTISSLSDDATPPTTPAVEVLGMEIETAPDGSRGIRLRALTPLTVRWTAADPESGIGGYEYALGTTPGAADVQGWTSTGGRQQANVPITMPASGGVLYINVRALNGRNATSAIGSSPVLRYEPVAPVTATPADVGPATPTASQPLPKS